MAHLPCAPTRPQCQAALLGSGRLIKIAHPGTSLWQKAASARIAPEFNASPGRYQAPFWEPASPDSRRPRTPSGRQERFPVPDCPPCFSPRPGAPQSGARGLATSLDRQRSHQCCGSRCRGKADNEQPSPVDFDLGVHVPGAAYGHGFGCLSSKDESFPVTTKSL